MHRAPSCSRLVAIVLPILFAARRYLAARIAADKQRPLARLTARAVRTVRTDPESIMAEGLAFAKESKVPSKILLPQLPPRATLP